VTTETRQLACRSGAWQVVENSTAVTQKTDESEWVRVTDDLSSAGSFSTESLSALINAKLSTFNSQPGADTTPFDYYRKISE
jgi:hypothetical protein